MNLVSYLINQTFYRVYSFLRHWYVDSFFKISATLHKVLEELDRRIALKVSLRYIFQPMYGDRTIIGYIFGFLFRLIRILIGIVLYFFFVLLALLSYLILILIPIVILAWGIFA